MRCPACRNTVEEVEAICAACGFSLEALAALMGMTPMLPPPLADPGGILSSSEKREVLRAVAGCHRRFPQVSLAIAMLPLAQDVPLSLQTFWYFNRSGLFSAVEKGGDNHGVMLLLDADLPGRTAAMVGYGLEPFVPDTILELCLTAASGSLFKKQWGAGITAFVRELERQLQPLAERIPAIFGLVPAAQWQETAHAQPQMESLGSEQEDLF